MELILPLKVLVVDDNDLHRNLMVHMLELVGHSADVVDSGEKAIEAVKTNNYSLVLLDLAMPNMDGFMAAEAIKSECPNAPYIIIVSALNLHSSKQRCRDAGINDLLQKPVLLNDFKAALSRYYQVLG